MVRQSNRKDYTGISMPRLLMNEVDHFMKEHEELSFDSRAEFIKCAIREKLKSYS